MKKAVSLLLAVLMMTAVLWSVPAFAADPVITTVAVKSEKELFDKIAGGYSGASFTSTAYGETKNLTLNIDKDCYAFINISSRLDDLTEYLSQDISMVSVTTSKNLFSHFTYDKGMSAVNELKALEAGTYIISIKEENTAANTHTSVNVGIFDKNTQFIKGTYVKTVKNSGHQSAVLKITAVDTIKKLYADNSNYGYVSGVKTVGKEYTLDANGCITVPLEFYEGHGYPYFTLCSEDQYGLSHEYWFGILTAETAEIRDVSNKTYTGKALKQTKFTVECFNDAPTYKVSYKNNKNVGTATMILTGTGRWSGSVKKTFKINPKSTALSKVTPGAKKATVSWKKQATQTTGYEIQYALKSNFKGAKTYTVKKNKTVKATVKKLKSKKTYYFRIRTYKTVSGKKYYSSWSKKKSIKVR